MKQEEYYGRMFIKKCNEIAQSFIINNHHALDSKNRNRLISYDIDWMYWPWAYDRYLELKEKYKWTNKK